MFSAAGLICAAPVLLPTMAVIWLQDFRPPLYTAPRVGEDGKTFRMVKLRSTVANADKSGVDGASANDNRMTNVGRFIRACKLDELSQLWNVLLGDMSLVGPRPNVANQTGLYTAEERKLLSARPGITDISSIVFSDAGSILANSADPDLDYNRLIRPWKSRLGILYIENRSLGLDLTLIAATAVAIVSRRTALRFIDNLLATINAPTDVRAVSRREQRLLPASPPGASRPVIAADLYGGEATV